MQDSLAAAARVRNAAALALCVADVTCHPSVGDNALAYRAHGHTDTRTQEHTGARTLRANSNLTAVAYRASFSQVTRRYRHGSAWRRRRPHRPASAAPIVRISILMSRRLRIRLVSTPQRARRHQAIIAPNRSA
ncbi:unnamed protein product, partial [Iphiclides podalirius]